MPNSHYFDQAEEIVHEFGCSADRRREAVRLYRQALAAGDERAIGGIATNLFLLDASEAVQFCQQNISHLQSKVVLGVAYFEGTGGLSVDLAKAERLLKAAASEDSRIAKFNLCILYHEQKDYEREYYWAKEAAEAGHPRGKVWLMTMVQTGRGLPPEKYADHVAYLRSINDSAEGDYLLGLHYEHGTFGLPKDPAQAHAHYTTAASHNHAEAMTRLGKLVAQHPGQFGEAQAEAEWYRKAVEAGSVEGHIQLALLLIEGRVQARNVTEAETLLDAIEATPDAKAARARLYLLPEVNKTEEGERLREEAAEAGSLMAMLDIVEAQPTAVQWLERAAKQGDVGTMEKLGAYHLETQHLADAARWLYSANQLGSARGKELLTNFGHQAEAAFFSV